MPNFPKLKSSLRQVGVEPALFLYIVSSFLRFPIFQSLVYQKVCHEKYGIDAPCSNSTFAHQDKELQTRANHVFLLSTLCLTIPSMFISVILGSLSDKMSRKLPILVPFVGLMFQDLNDLVQTTFIDLSVYWLLLSDLLFGCFGGFISILSTMFAYGIEQSKTVKHRSYRMAILEGSIGVGGTVGYLISGVLLRKMGYVHVFLLNSILHFVAYFYILFVVADLVAKKTENDESRPGNPLKRFFTNAVKVVFRPREGNLRMFIILILLAFAFEDITFAGSQDINLYYLKHQLGWGTVTYGYFSGVQFGAGSFAILIIYPLLRKYFLPDTLLAEIGLVTKCIGLVCFSFVFATWFAFVVCAFYTFSRFIAAGLRATVSRLVEPDEHGKIFAAIALLEGVCSLIATSVFNAIYPETLGFFPGLSYLILAFILGLAAVFTAIVHVKAAGFVISEQNGAQSPTSYGSVDEIHEQ